MVFLRKAIVAAGAAASLAGSAAAQGVNINGVLDGIEELVTRREYMVPMSDGVRLATDVFMPILVDDLAFDTLRINLGLTELAVPRLKLATRGTQLMYYPNQPNPFQLPVVFTRTPYNKSDPTQGQVEALMGYCGVVQDMRGRYRSEGTYYPMYSDSWAKEPYVGDARHPLDTTWNRAAGEHQDGHESVEWITHDLRWDFDGDGVLDEKVCNGKIGMVGASALGNTQYQAAAVEYTDTDAPGLKCLVPIVASGEFYHSTGHHNGVFRERIIDGWLRGQVERYDWVDDPSDNSVFNNIHSLHDYGADVRDGKAAAEKAIDFWTTMFHAHYPNSRFRAVMDISKATLDFDGKPVAFGPVSRYRNLDLPIYNLTGWWDIFIDGQLETWARLRQHTVKHKKHQKIVIGPWAHQTIGTRATGDCRQIEGGPDHRYPENVNKIIGANFDDLDVTNLGGLARSEVIDWFRTWLGSPRVRLPQQNEWQYVGNVLGSNAYIAVPAEDYEISFETFFNFLNGTGPLPEFPLRLKGIIGFDSNAVTRLTIPATGQSLIGDRSGARLEEGVQYNFDDTAPDGVKAVRYYVVGNVGEDKKFGNYWVAADTFPNPALARQKLYFRGDGGLTPDAPTQNEGTRTFVADPNTPVPTHGGPNMIVRTPDDKRDSQGQMNFTDPMYRNLVRDRLPQIINGDTVYDIVSFESEAVADSFSIAGVPIATFYAASTPLSQIVPDSTNCDFIVRVVDVYPDGRELYVFEGAVNARARDYAKKWAETGVEDVNVPWSNIVSGRVYEYKMRMLPIAYTFAEGHKIKVMVSSTSYPRYQACANIPLQPGEFYRRRPYEDKSYNFYGTTLYPRKALQTLPISDVYAANIDFPVVGKTAEFVSRESGAKTPSSKFVMYPNPAEDVVALSAEKPGGYRYSVFDPTGREVLSAAFTDVATIYTDKLPRGIYVVKITDGSGQTAVKKLVLN